MAACKIFFGCLEISYLELNPCCIMILFIMGKLKWRSINTDAYCSWPMAIQTKSKKEPQKTLQLRTWGWVQRLFQAWKRTVKGGVEGRTRRTWIPTIIIQIHASPRLCVLNIARKSWRWCIMIHVIPPICQAILWLPLCGILGLILAPA